MAGAAAVIAATTVTPACGRIAGTDQAETQAKDGTDSSPAADLVYELGPGTVDGLDSKQFETQDMDVSPTQTRPVTATAYEVNGQTYVRVDGDPDSLEGVMPAEVMTEVDLPAGRGHVTSGHGRGYLFGADLTIKDEIVEGDVAILGPPAGLQNGMRPPQKFINVALALAGPNPEQVGKEVARGDLSALVGAARGTMLSYPAEPDPTLRIYTFPDASISPVLADMAPLFRSIKVGGGTGYAFGEPGADTPGSPGPAPSIAFQGPEGGLVVIASPHGFTTDGLRTIATKLRRADA